MLVCVPEEVLMQYSPVLNSSPESKIRIFFTSREAVWSSEGVGKKMKQVSFAFGFQFSKFDFIKKI